MLEKINYPSDLKKLSMKELEALAPEIRKKLIDVVSKNGGHLASNLGIVELTMALHYVFTAPADKIIWDVSHQCYAHKLLTGRQDRFHTLRKYEGISGFCKREESEYDAFDAGHASTSISASLGMAVGRDMSHRDNYVIAVIGDASFSGGMAMEAVNQAGHLGKNLIIILNDNEMSISPNVGAWSGYLKRIIDGQAYTVVARDVQSLLKSIPGIGDQVLKTTKNIVDALKTFIVPGKLLEELGLQYVGPVNGHSVSTLIDTLNQAKELDGPILLHVVTRKGKGYPPAENDPDKWHGASPFNIVTGKGLTSASTPSYTSVFADKLVELGKKDPKIVALTAAMMDGTGLKRFKEEFPDRCFDVGIAEQHAVTFAGGLATEGLRPVVAIYSTFLQRAYDQIFHDICLMNLPVVFALDRAGIVGEDGPTHHGLFDLTYLRSLPNMTVMAPKDEGELCNMLETAVTHNGPIAIRFPRGTGLGVNLDQGAHTLPIGKGEVLRQGSHVALVAVGSMVHPALQASEKLEKKGIDCSVLNARFVKPIDESLLKHTLQNTFVVTLEEGTLIGGFGSAVLEFIQENEIPTKGIFRIGLPDKIVPAGSQKILRARYQLDSEGIADSVEEFLVKKGWPRKESTASLLQWDWLKPAKRQKR